MMDRHVECTACGWAGHHSEANRVGMDRQCPECNGGLRIQEGDPDA